MKKRVVIASDHGAVDLKDRIIKHLESRDLEVVNLGVDSSDDSVDYPDMALSACNKFMEGDFEFGILCCGTGIGISIAANKVPGIRCALVHNLFTAEMAKNHNNANFLAFGGRLNYEDSVEVMLDKFIETEFGGDRHQRRITKMMNIDNL